MWEEQSRLKPKLADFLRRVLSLSASGASPAVSKVSVSSAGEIHSDQTTQLDQQTGTPIIAPLDTLQEVS